MNRRGERPTTFRTIPCAKFHLQTSVPQNERLLDDQEIEAPRVDNSPSSHAEDTGEKENKGDKHRPDVKAERGRDAAKSIQSRSVNGLARLRVLPKGAGKHFGYGYQLKPPCVRGFLL
jgi:hypothetical protein